MSTLFGNFLREKRKDRHFTVKTTAKLIGKSTSYVSQLESGIRLAPKQKTLEAICEALVLDEAERDRLYDLAAKTRNSIPDDLTDYINSHEEVKETLKISQKRNVPEKEWRSFLKDIKEKFC